MLTGKGVSFPCELCHATLQGFMALDCPELRLLPKCDASTHYEERMATSCALSVYSVADAHATQGDENLTDNPLFEGTRSPSHAAIYEPQDGEPYLACALRRLQDEVFWLRQSKECSGAEVPSAGFSVGRPDQEIERHQVQQKQEACDEWQTCLYEPILLMDNWREGEAPFVVFECTPLDMLYVGQSTSYVVVQCPDPSQKVERPTGSDELTLAAHRWHAKRRQAMTRKHREGVQRMMSGGPCYTNIALLVFGVVAQPMLALYAVPALSLWAQVVLAWTAGSFFCNAFQALNHELSHELRVPKWRQVVNHAFMIAGAGQCSFPWHAYYAFFHGKHHAYTGSSPDKDGVILFSAWYRAFPCLEHSVLGRLLWTAIFGVGIFGFYLYNKALELQEDTKDMPEQHRRTLAKMTLVGLAKLLGTHCTVWMLVHGLLWWYAGFQSALYMWMSAAFANGAFAHPYLGFWLIQHKCCSTDDKQFQPTVSYSGSGLWHLLNLGELRHIEHHDFPTVPWTRLHQIRKIAPEFYNAPTIQKTVPSIWAEIWAFISAESNEAWLRENGDFAGRSRFLENTTKVWPSRLEPEE